MLSKKSANLHGLMKSVVYRTKQLPSALYTDPASEHDGTVHGPRLYSATGSAEGLILL